MAVSIINVPLEDRKQVWIGLKSKIFGIGKTRSFEICKAANVDPFKKVSELTKDEVQAIADICKTKYVLEGDLRRSLMQDLKRLKDIGCYRGRRHIMRLPARGQRTKTNARTRKGPRRMAESTKKQNSD